jgi:hypothetical protein
VSYYAFNKFETAIKEGDVVAIQAWWPSVKKMVSYQVDHKPATNRSLNQE